MTTLATEPVPTVTLKIDGHTITVPKGTNLLEAAKTIGVQVPFFCYHPGLSAPAVCRQCLVEVKGIGKPIPACYTPVADNMEVLTQSPRALEVRAQMLEFTLVNHPVDCPICDKAGECTLQKLYYEFDGAHSRVDYDKVHKPKVVDLGPTVVLDVERCISCTRCIRVCDEVAHSHQLEMSQRGDRTQISTAPGHQLDNAYSLNTVDVCPVGALTSKDFRFAMRAWELNTTNSICAGCATGCNIEVHHAHEQIYRLVPRENPAVNKFWMCDEGRVTYKEVKTRRVAGARLNGEPAPVDKAINFAAERIAALKGQSGNLDLMGVVLNAQATNEDNWLLMRAATALGVQHVYLAGRPPRPDRADDILMHADVNPNTTGVRFIQAAAGGKGKSTTQLSMDLASGSLKALWMLGDHVDLDEEAQEALAKLDLVVYQSPHENFLTDRVNVLLPASSWAEVDGTFTNAKGMVQRIRRTVEAPGELVQLLARKLGVVIDYPNVRSLFHQMKQAVPEFATAEFGRELPVLQLRFAGSRG